MTFKNSVSLYKPSRRFYSRYIPRVKKTSLSRIASACYLIVGLWLYIRRSQTLCPSLPTGPRDDSNGVPTHDTTRTISSESEDDFLLQPGIHHPGFPPYSRYAALMAKASNEPDMIHVDFEEAVANERLVGWEDAWIANATYDVGKWGEFKEPKIDFIYTWVNGTEEAFQRTKLPYMLNSTLKDHLQANSGKNRYRDWDELRYSIRSIEKFAKFRNNIQLLVNDVYDNNTGQVHRQSPTWLSQKSRVKKVVQVLSQSEFFEQDKQDCLPTFNSLTIENQLQNTPSDVDRLFALSDDMLLGKEHAASDLYSPLFGPVLAFKTNQYSTTKTPGPADAARFGEKPWIIYTSWLLNRRFGERKRKGQAHFGHSLSRRLLREAFSSFPRPEIQSACSRFRGDIQSDVSGFQIYSWYLAFHYAIERHREALIWSYITQRSDPDRDEFLSWPERKQITQDLEEGMQNLGKTNYRIRTFYHLPIELEKAGLESPKVNTNILWTSLDGPAMIKDTECLDFDVNECLAHGFTVPHTGNGTERRNMVFSTATVFDRLTRQNPLCGDCLIKTLLHRTPRGLGPMLPLADTQPQERAIVIKSLMKYQYNIVDMEGLFVMVTDAEQVESTLIRKFEKKTNRVGQLCLNDDVATEDEQELDDMRRTMKALYETLLPERTPYEKTSS